MSSFLKAFPEVKNLPSDKKLSMKIYVKSFSCANSMVVRSDKESSADRTSSNSSNSNSTISCSSSSNVGSSSTTASTTNTTTTSISNYNDNTNINKFPAFLLFHRKSQKYTAPMPCRMTYKP